MTLDDINITFGKSVLIEKAPKKDFQEIFDVLCKEVPGSYLHCDITSTDTITIIRYTTLEKHPDYCALRIVLFKRLKIIPPEASTTTILNGLFEMNIIRRLLFHYSNGQHTYKTYVDDFLMIDSRVKVCHKESLSEIILRTMINEVKELIPYSTPEGAIVTGKSNYVAKCKEMYCDSPSIRPEVINDCNSLYGTKDDANPYRKDRFLSDTDFKLLQHDVNIWRNKLKRKGRRLLLKSITSEPL
jgi:hypothetical protein